MSAPSLSIDIPPPRSKFIVKHGEVVPEQEADSDTGSAASSICQSPGWAQLTDTKKKKEKKEAKERKKEKEKAEAKALAKAKSETKQPEKHRNRLSKAAPPPNKKLSRMSLMMNRSTSAPIVPQAPILEPLNFEFKEETKTHIDATPIVPAPWKTAHGTPLEQTPVGPSPAQEILPTRVSNDGFIGGLKLKLAEAASVQDRMRRQSLTEERRMNAVQRPGSDSDSGLGDNRVESAQEAEMRNALTNADEDSTRTPQQWDSIYEQAARMMRSTGPPEEPQVADRSSKKPWKKTYPPTSYFPVEFDESTSLRTSSANSNGRIASQPRSSEDWDGWRPDSAFSSERPSLNTRDTSVDRGTPVERGRSAQSHVGHQRKQTEDRSFTGHEDETKVSENARKESAPRGRRLSFTSIRNFARNSSTDATSTVKSFGRVNQNGSVPPIRTTADSKPQSGENGLVSPVERSLHNRRSSSKGNIPTLKGFKNAAKSVFSRGPTVTSPTEIDTSPRVAHGNTEQSRSKNSSSSGSADGSMSKAERIFEQPISAEFCASPTESRSGSSENVSTTSREQNGNGYQDRQHEGYHSRSTTDSSEDYSTHDESSNVTTPLAPHAISYYDSFPQIHDDDLVLENPGLRMNEKHSFTMTNGMPLKPQVQDSRVPDLNHSTISHNPSMPKIPLPTEVSQSPTDLRRQTSLSRSTSTPELLQQQQDLSFLPPLRHQPLKKPAKEKKGKGRPSPLSQPQPQEKNRSKSGSLTKLEPPSPLVSKSAGSSPTSPISSQYLQNARNSIPRPPARAMQNQSANQSGPDPIAKMFVVCCSCKYFHDMPSKIYECMARSESVVEDKNLGVSGVVSTSVRCPWCGHGMTTACCAGYAAVVVLREKLH